MCAWGTKTVFVRHHQLRFISGNFLMIGDIHIDNSYRNTSESCNSNIPKNELGKFGHYECDVPYVLAESAVAALKMEADKSNADFVVWMG